MRGSGGFWSWSHILLFCGIITGSHGKNSTRSSTINTRQSAYFDANSANKELWEFLSREIRHCDMKSFAIISDGVTSRNDDENSIMTDLGIMLDFFQSVGIPCVYHDGNLSSLQPWLRRMYVNFSVYNFILAVDKPGEILQAAESVFLQESHGELAMFPHRTRWLVIYWTGQRLTDVANQQHRSVLDNVAAVKVTMPRGKRQYEAERQNFTTFMWRQNRTREPVCLSLAHRNGGNCGLFPNSAFGLNGRNLKALWKKYRQAFFQVQRSHETGETQISGILADTLNFAADALNFTYTIFPDIDSSLTQGLSWFDYLDLVSNGSVDIGLSPWSVLFRTLYQNISFSYPVVFDDIVGVYRRPRDNPYFYSLFFVFPFPLFIYLLLLSCLLYTVSLYTIMENGIYSLNHSRKCIMNQYPRDKKTDNNSDNVKHRNGRCRVFIKSASKYFSTLGVFLSSLMNQAYLPTPQQMSARIVVATWAFGAVIHHALFCSLITAKMVTNKKALPFRTFAELVQRDDYDSVMYKTSIVADAILATDTEMFRKLKEKLIFVNKSESATLDDFIENVMGSLDDRTVVISYQSAIKRWLHIHDKGLEDYYIMTHDPLFRSDISIIFSNSELANLISETILTLFDTGIQSEITEKYYGVRKLREFRGFVGRDESYIDLGCLFWLSLVCAVCLSIAFFILVLEICVTKLNFQNDLYVSGVSNGQNT